MLPKPFVICSFQALDWYNANDVLIVAALAFVTLQAEPRTQQVHLATARTYTKRRYPWLKVDFMTGYTPRTRSWGYKYIPHPGSGS